MSVGRMWGVASQLSSAVPPVGERGEQLDHLQSDVPVKIGIRDVERKRNSADRDSFSASRDTP
jgi:hypothetical protein